MDAAAAEKWRESVSITLDTKGFEPFLTFGEAGFSSELLECTKNFTAPTPIQAQTWPILTSGRDVIGIAETGSGKTLSFALPGLQRCLEARSGGSQQRQSKPAPFVLVLAPTRELAKQSDDVLSDISSVASVVIYGGVPKYEQIKQLNQGKGGRKGADCVVATPGRLLDLLEAEALTLAGVEYLVLDEADRMLDMGFERDVRRIISMCSPKHQTAMFSATWPQAIRKLANDFLTRPVRVTVGSDDLSANVRITQHVEVFEDERKRGQRLLQLLNKVTSTGDRVLVFALYKKEAARLEVMLRQKNFVVSAIHGDLSQEARERAVEAFRNKSVPILVATDVAARGLDIPDVETVINYAFPLTVEDYVHRIGRTGRAGKTGVAYTFFHDFDKNNAGGLVNILREAGQEVPEALTKRYSLFTKKKEHGMYGAHFKNVDPAQSAKRITFDSDSD